MKGTISMTTIDTKNKTFTAIMSSKEGNTFHNFTAPSDSSKEQLMEIGKAFETATETLYGVVEALDVEVDLVIEDNNGVKTNLPYALERTDKHNTKYVIECIEYGEEFVSDFFAPSNYTEEQLMLIGRDVAMTWGAECISVYKE